MYCEDNYYADNELKITNNMILKIAIIKVNTYSY